jgi:transposase InsO family protein
LPPSIPDCAPSRSKATPRTAYRDRFELVYRRTASRANGQWQCDHTELDIEIVDAAGARARPWLTVVLDDYSRAVAGYTVFTGGLRISTMGLPESVARPSE